MFGIELQIFVFSHCRDVVVEASKAGGMGVFGISGFTEEQLEREFRWIDDHIEGKPYAVDILMPNNYQAVSQNARLDPANLLPKENLKFLDDLLNKHGVPQLPAGEAKRLFAEQYEHINMTQEDGERLIEVAFRHKGVKLMVNALGTPPKHLVDRAHSFGVKVGSLVGKPEHAMHQIEVGVDVIVAQGMEAGSHTGNITSMVLWPQIVDAVAPIPVLATGGVVRGRQMAAALALGSEGVGCGSIWLGTIQNDMTADIKERLFAAKSEDAVQRKVLTGKQCRILKSVLTEAYEQPGAPEPLPLPLQTLLLAESNLRIERGHAKGLLTYPVGQVVAKGVSLSYADQFYALVA